MYERVEVERGVREKRVRGKGEYKGQRDRKGEE